MQNVLLNLVNPVEINWKKSLGRLAVGDKLRIPHLTQSRVSSSLADYNKGAKRFVSKRSPEGVYVIRVL